MQILRAGDSRALPWKNGLGVSSIIASQPPEAGYDSLAWQVSTTRIEADCPFSSLPGLDRQFMLLEGEGVELRCKGANGVADLRRTIDKPFVPFAFSGDWRTDCRLLAGPVKVFNVLSRRSAVEAWVALLAIETVTMLELRSGATLVACVMSGALDVGTELGPNDALLFENDKARLDSVRVTGTPGTRLLTVRIAPRTTSSGQ